MKLSMCEVIVHGEDGKRKALFESRKDAFIFISKCVSNGEYATTPKDFLDVDVKDK